MQKIRRVSATVTTLRRGASIRRTTGKADTLLINGSAVRARYALKQGAHCAPPCRFSFGRPPREDRRSVVARIVPSNARPRT